LDNATYWINRKNYGTANQPGQVLLRTELLDQDGGEVSRDINIRCKLIVRDNGPGVSAETLAHLKTFPLSYTTRADEGGSGYGLWALRQYMDTVGGWVELDSEAGEFFEVSILLDLFNDKIHRQKKWGRNW
jgi:signal transduction histidine kinase